MKTSGWAGSVANRTVQDRVPSAPNGNGSAA